MSEHPANQPQRDPMSDLLGAMGDAIFPEGAMNTAWVLVSEWMDAEGNYWTHSAKDSRNPIWRHTGLVQHALDDGLDADEDDDEGIEDADDWEDDDDE
jgi:hypothetical protein